jgi:hypothetical protein
LATGAVRPLANVGGRVTNPPQVANLPHKTGTKAGVYQDSLPCRASLAIASGILTATLFPHFDNRVSFGIWIYIEDTRQPGSPTTRYHRNPGASEATLPVIR